MKKPIVLDLFCGGGGAAMGYYRAGYEVVGVDNQYQPKYPFRFILGDALCYAVAFGRMFDLIHASPPCKDHTSMRHLYGLQYKSLIGLTRSVLQWIGRPYIIENVEGAPLVNPIMLCGTMFGLNVVKHRLFECSTPVYFAPATCRHVKPVVKAGRRPNRNKHYASVVGHFSDVEFARQSMGIDWLGQKELAQAIPPVYTEWLIGQMKPS